MTLQLFQKFIRFGRGTLPLQEEKLHNQYSPWSTGGDCVDLSAPSTTVAHLFKGVILTELGLKGKVGQWWWWWLDDDWGWTIFGTATYSIWDLFLLVLLKISLKGTWAQHEPFGPNNCEKLLIWLFMIYMDWLQFVNIAKGTTDPSVEFRLPVYLV